MSAGSMSTSRSFCAPLACAGAAVLAACAATPSEGTLRAEETRIERAPRERLDPSPGFVPQVARELDELELPPAPGPEDYVALALERNPGVLAAEHRLRRSIASAAQAGSLEDPRLMLSPIGDMAETAAGQVGWMSSITQMLPFPGKLGARERAARHEAEAARFELDQKRLELRADVRRAYWELWFSVRGAEVVEQSRALLAQLRDTARTRYEAGTAQQADVLRAETELAELDDELVTWSRRRAMAAGRLNSLLSRPVVAPLAEPEPRELRRVEIQLDDLLRQAEGANPDLAGARELLGARQERLDLARRARYPDFGVGFTYNAVDEEGLSPVANGDDQWWLTLEFNLPVWFGRLDAAEREAREGVLEQRMELDAAADRVAFGVQEAFVGWDAEQRRALLLRDVVLPQARQTLDVSAGAYRAGSLEFSGLVDAWRRLLDAELESRRSIALVEESLAALELAVGEPLAAGGRP